MDDNGVSALNMNQDGLHKYDDNRIMYHHSRYKYDDYLCQSYDYHYTYDDTP